MVRLPGPTATLCRATRPGQPAPDRSCATQRQRVWFAQDAFVCGERRRAGRRFARPILLGVLRFIVDGYEVGRIRAPHTPSKSGAGR
jgi:hypothetical protein